MSRRSGPPQAAAVTGGVRHDLRHELATLRTLFAVAQDDPDLDPAELRALLATATGEVSYALDLLDTMPGDAGVLPPSGEPTIGGQADLTGVLRDAAATVAPGGASVVVEAAGPMYVAMSRTALVRVVRNLLGNALTATGGAGTVLLRAERLGPDGYIRLEIHDDGSGPGRTGFSRPGGQGLTVVRSLVLAAGGWLVLGRSPASGGTCASVTLPAARKDHLR